MALIINLFGAPSSGKTTMSWGLAYELSLRKFKVELSPEVLKKFIYYGNDLESIQYKSQAFLNEQKFNLISLNDCKEIDIVITDAPLALYAFYETKNSTIINPSIIETRVFNGLFEFKKFDYQISFYLGFNEYKDYSSVGRVHTKEQAIEIDKKLRVFMNENKLGAFEYPVFGFDQQVKVMADVIYLAIQNVLPKNPEKVIQIYE